MRKSYCNCYKLVELSSGRQQRPATLHQSPMLRAQHQQVTTAARRCPHAPRTVPPPHHRSRALRSLPKRRIPHTSSRSRRRLARTTSPRLAAPPPFDALSSSAPARTSMHSALRRLSPPRLPSPTILNNPRSRTRTTRITQALVCALLRCSVALRCTSVRYCT